MGTRKRMLRGLLAVAVAAMFGFAAQPAAPAAAAAPRANCYLTGDQQFAQFRAQVKAFEKEGRLSRDVAAAVTCDPRTAPQYYTYEVKVDQVVAPMWLSGCKQSSKWTITWSLGGELGGHSQNLNFCWSQATHKVSDWNGICSGYTTGWGTTNGWRWEGCSRDTFNPYTMDGYYPAGIHHSTQGHWSNLVPWTTDMYLNLDIWGHWDGTCDTKYNSTIRNYC
ncbi:hypothetical protein ACFYPG_23300 [Micromonospora sp. NPDC005553]|uniref:hypothetical protein n=1 Tax=Micromonospora sp. NPDC005553 TaxID=3364232 RepID=UPI0036A54CAA